MAQEAKVRIINIMVRQGPSGMLFATSDDLKGLMVGARTREDLMIEIPACIKLLMAEQGLAVDVYPVDGSDADVPPWAAIPAHMIHHHCAAE
jgi:hypothetical protein